MYVSFSLATVTLTDDVKEIHPVFCFIIFALLRSHRTYLLSFIETLGAESWHKYYGDPQKPNPSNPTRVIFIRNPSHFHSGSD